MKQCNPMTGYVHSLETFGLVDGPGVRYVIFLQGCRMRCQYCHNPETWQEGAGNVWTADALFRQAYRYRTYWKNNGGITVSGGEPLLQMDFVTELFSLAHEAGVHTALDTSGNPFCTEPAFLERFERLMQYTDLVILDIKEMDEEKHRRLTGQTNENILAMAHWLSAHGKPLWLRHVIVPGLTDDADGLQALRRLKDELASVQRVELLPYHTLGVFKWEKLGLSYPLAAAKPPTEDELARASQLVFGD